MVTRTIENFNRLISCVILVSARKIEIFAHMIQTPSFRESKSFERQRPEKAVAGISWFKLIETIFARAVTHPKVISTIDRNSIRPRKARRAGRRAFRFRARRGIQDPTRPIFRARDLPQERACERGGGQGGREQCHAEQRRQCGEGLDANEPRGLGSVCLGNSSSLRSDVNARP